MGRLWVPIQFLRPSSPLFSRTGCILLPSFLYYALNVPDNFIPKLSQCQGLEVLLLWRQTLYNNRVPFHSLFPYPASRLALKGTITQCEKHQIWDLETGVEVLALPLLSCVNLQKSVYFIEAQFLHLLF